jgi:hypothetical protein
MKRVTYKSITERKNNSEYTELPKLRDILVDLSVKNTPKVERKLRLVGLPIKFYEYNDKKRVPGEKNKAERVPFPDADKTKMITRIGAFVQREDGSDDRSMCPWYQAGYIGSRKFAVKCFEQQADKTWVPKILCKGPSVFDEFGKWEQNQLINLEEDPNLCTFLGGDLAPVVRIVAVADDSKLGGVDYSVFAGSANVQINEDMINMLRKIYEPKADDLNKLRAEYLADMEEDESLPDWRDYFEYGFDLRRIFKYNPPIADQKAEQKSVLASEATGEVAEEAEESSELEDLNW